MEDQRTRFRWSKTTGYVAFTLGFRVVVNIWVEAMQQLGTFLGLLTAGLAIAYATWWRTSGAGCF